MKIKRTLAVPAAYFYTKVIDSVLYDIKQNTGEMLKPQALQGYEYRKPMGKVQARVKITKNVINRTYAFETDMVGGKYIVSYGIQETQDGNVEVTYEEESKFTSTVRDWNQKLMVLLLGHGRKKQMIAMLDQIAASYTQA
ncbi:DUF3284 domain-containing protein [Lacticaseibacillus sp. GG6-2]